MPGSPVSISYKAGSVFSAHGGYIAGKAIQIVKDKSIVQTWRAADWMPEDPDSIFAIVLEPSGKDTILHVIHSGVPDAKAEGVDKGWFDR